MFQQILDEPMSFGRADVYADGAPDGGEAGPPMVCFGTPGGGNYRRMTPAEARRVAAAFCEAADAAEIQ